MKREQDGKGPKKASKRPYLSSMVNTLQDAEYWRTDLLKEISKSVMQIQNETLGEHKIRDLNDRINKLFREKWHWNNRIKELGGPDYREGGIVAGEDGAIRAPGGYYYFGAAKNLPGVKELLTPQQKDTNKRTRKDLYQGIDTDYYGFRDDEDGLLERLEAETSKKVREEMIADWNRQAIEKYGSLDKAPVPKKRKLNDNSSVPSDDDLLKSHVELPSAEDIEKTLLQRRKEELMKRYVGND